MRRVAPLLVMVLVVVAACGGASEAESARRDHVDTIRAAAQDGDADRARAAIEKLRALVEGQLADGEIDPDEAARVLAAAEGVEVALGPPPTQVTTTTTTTTTTAPPPPPPDDDRDDKDEGKGRDKGNEKEDD